MKLDGAACLCRCTCLQIRVHPPWPDLPDHVTTVRLEGPQQPLQALMLLMVSNRMGHGMLAHVQSLLLT